MSNVVSLDEYRKKKKIAVLFDRFDPNCVSMARYVEISETPPLSKSVLAEHMRRLLQGPK